MGHENQLNEMETSHALQMIEVTRPESITEAVQAHEEDRVTAMQGHPQSKLESKRSFSTLRHAESVQALIQQHELEQQERAHQLVEKNERILAIEQQTTRDLGRNLDLTKQDVDRLEKLLAAQKNLTGEKDEKYQAIQLALQIAEQLQEHMKENAVLSATAAAELAKLRQETNKNTTKYKAEEARLLADLEEMKRAESALRDSYKKQLEKEQKMHQKTKEERKKLNDTLAQEIEKEKKIKIDLANELEKGSQLKTALATVQNDLSTTEAERNKKIEELVQTKQKHEAVTFALMADVAAATNERKET